MTGRKVGLIIIAVLGAVLLGAMVFLFVQRRSLSQTPVTNVPVVTPTENNASQTADDGCETKTGEERDGCYISTAASGKDLRLCEQVSDTSKQAECKRFVTVSLAVDRRDTALCATLTATDEQTACENRVFIAVAGVSGCDAFFDTQKERCRTTQILLTAKSVADCAQIADETLRERCTADLAATSGSHAIDRDGDGLPDFAETTVYRTNPTKKDTDGDTLSDYDEVYTYRTSPLKKDTDGDGFDDNIEIAKGFNPNGPGPAPKKR
jgi:hypothetical protein